jgi:hypothetical protein
MLTTLVVVVAGAILGIGLVLAWLRIEHGLTLTLPMPTGPFEVGRTTFHWVDTSRTDSRAPVPNLKRELVVWVWYPAAPKSSASGADYQPAPWRAAIERNQGVLMSKFFTRDPALVRAHSMADAELSPAERKYPVVILKAVGVFGHSFGGAAVAQFCHDEPRCKAGVDIDGAPYGTVIQEGLSQPFLFLLSDHGDPRDAESRQILANIQSIRRKQKDGCSLVTLRGSRHFNFSDQSLLKDRYLSRLFGAVGSVGERHGLAITSAYLHTFFDVYLKGAPAKILENLPSLYPELSLEPP